MCRVFSSILATYNKSSEKRRLLADVGHRERLRYFRAPLTALDRSLENLEMLINGSTVSISGSATVNSLNPANIAVKWPIYGRICAH